MFSDIHHLLTINRISAYLDIKNSKFQKFAHQLYWVPIFFGAKILSKGNILFLKREFFDPNISFLKNIPKKIIN
jgi:hypothetical protein